MEENPNPEATSPAPSLPPSRPGLGQGVNLEKRRAARTQVLTAILGLVLVATAGYAYYSRSNANQSPAAFVADSKLKNPLPANYCFIRLDKLVCVDSKGAHRIRYDLPVLEGKTVQALVPNIAGTQYAALTGKANAGPFDIWLLDQNLKPQKKLKLPAGDTPEGPSCADGDISWSHDGKSLLLTLELKVPAGTAPNRQVFRYTVATDKSKQLTGQYSATYNYRPHELKDGRITYWSYVQNTPGLDNGSPERAMVMKGDGTGEKPLPEIKAPDGILSAALSNYDPSTDTVYYVYIHGDKTEILFWPGSQIGRESSAAQISVVPASDTSTYVTPFDTDTWVYQHDSLIEFLNPKTGKAKATIKQTGNAVGILKNRAGFKVSKPQEESKYERIRDLSSAPADFQTFIKKEFDASDKLCTEGEAGYNINKVVRDSFAGVGEGCMGGAVYFYSKKDGKWTFLFATQDEPPCDEINKSAFTKELIPECYDTKKSQSVPNTNP